MMRHFGLIFLLFISVGTYAQQDDSQTGNDTKVVDPCFTNEEDFRKFVSEHSDGNRNATDGGYDQLIKNTTPISPQAESVQKYGEFPMDYSTGVPSISIPLYEIKVGNYTLPISIAYHASGIKVQDMATPVGLGWVLNAGGVINRQCKGTEDEVQADTLLMTYQTELGIDYAMAAGNRTNYWWSRLAHKGEGDTESDRYTYSINGKSSVFRYSITDKALRTIPTSDVKVERISTGGFKITDTDGTKYYFTYGETNSDYSTSTLSAVTTWYVTRIEPSTSTIPIVFSYTSGQQYTMSYITQMDNNGTSYDLEQSVFGNHQLVENPYYSDSYQSYGGQYHGTVLLSQISWAGNTIVFNYVQDRLERGWNLDRLSSITVKYNGQTTIRHISFDNDHYLGSSQSNYRMMLEGLTIQGSSSTNTMTYGFGYDNTPLPNYFIIGSDQTCHEDYWGYYNGTHQSWIPSDSYSTTSSTSNRAPNSYMTAGTLTRITYPTGGRTELVMEPNALYDNRTWGGLRVQSLTNKAADGTILSSKTYQYADGYPAQDVIDDLYTYDVDYYYGFHDGAGLLWNIGSHTIKQSSPILSLTGDWGHPLYYRTVTEFVDGLGKTVYTYDVKRPSLNNMDDNGHIYDPLRLYSVQYNFDQGTIQPVLTGKTVYAQNGSSYTPKSSESYTYTEVTQTPFRLGVRFEESNVLINYGGIAIDDAILDTSPFHHEFEWSDVWAVPSFFHLTAKAVTDYDNKVTTTTTYSYDGTVRTHQPVSESVTTSDGQLLTTAYTYPSTDSGSDYSALVTANMHFPVKTSVTRGSTPVESTRTAYSTFSGLLLPSSLYIGKGNNTPEQRIEYDYDSFGNLTYLLKDGTIKTVFLWGYSGLHPIAKIEGLTKAQVYSSLSSIITTLAGTPTPTQVHGINTTLGTSALTTTYAWTPLVGITSMQSPRGEKSYFSYDSMGRLAGVSGHGGSTIESYTYNYGTQSYVRKRTMTDALGSGYRETTDYYDGLGRKSEMVAKAQAPGGNDLVTLTEYDGLDRPVREWLPTSFSGSGSYISPTSYTSASRPYYGSDTKPYSLTEYETCPSDKALKRYGPGADWQDNSKAVRREYTANTTSSPLDCRIYEVESNGAALKCTGTYDANELFVVQTTDEDSKVSYTFTDKEGRLVLERRMNGSTACDTYYVYDIYGNLTFVLPPLASDALTATNTTWSISSNDALKRYAYNYQYDSRNRCIQKKLPGCDHISMTYDTADRLITRQDGVQRDATTTTYYEYDGFGRQTEMGTKNALNVETPLLKYFYDDYSSLTATNLAINTSAGSDAAFPSNSSPNARGLLTGTWSALLNNTSTGYYTSYYYGERERLVQSHAQNHLGGVNDTYYTYNYIGTTATRKQVHSATGQNTQTELYSYTYDCGDRLLSTTYQLNGGTAVTLSVNTYDAVGRLGTHKPLNVETQTYGYNVRNWLTSITSTNFTEKLAYNTDTGNLSPDIPAYCGNIAAMQWQTGNESRIRGFQFEYTPLGFLDWADYEESGRPYAYDVYYYYDKMGNMTGFERNGHIENNLYDLVDIPYFTYDGNQPTRIDDEDWSLTFPYNGGYHFIDYVQQNNEYAYDKNGNMTQDLNKRISQIQYNLLNLPQDITFSTGSTIAYTYDAEGRKLNVTYGSPSKTINYSGNMVYENGTLSQILTEGGYVTLSGTTPTYHAYLRDHQGNNRVVINDSGTIEQVNHYYPFGYFFGESTNASTQRYKYNDKEFDEMHGLHWYDYGARHYDPAIMRFTTIDPMCEKYYHLSPYVYCANNPVNAVDPTGMDWVKTPDNDYIWMDNVTSYKDVPTGYSYIGTTGKDILTDLNINSDFNAQTSVGGALGVDGDEKLGGAIMASNYELTGSVDVSAIIDINPKNGYSNNSMGISFKGIKFEAYFNQKGEASNGNTSLNYKGNMELKVNDMTIYSPLHYSDEPQLQQIGSSSLKAIKEFRSSELKNNPIFWEVGISVGSPNPNSLYTKTATFTWNLLKQPIIIQK